ncbi:MAG: hypothetical protein MH213_00670 [Marinobacter sp.]|nr:hypothetical protein [Marinobacter sp.]
MPDEITILKFRHFLERQGLGKGLFKEVSKHLETNGLMLREGSIVDATNTYDIVPAGTFSTVGSGVYSVMLVILEFKSGMSTGNAKTSFGSLPSIAAWPKTVTGCTCRPRSAIC